MTTFHSTIVKGKGLRWVLMAKERGGGGFNKWGGDQKGGRCLHKAWMGLTS